MTRYGRIGVADRAVMNRAMLHCLGPSGFRPLRDDGHYENQDRYRSQQIWEWLRVSPEASAHLPMTLVSQNQRRWGHHSPEHNWNEKRINAHYRSFRIAADQL